MDKGSKKQMKNTDSQQNQFYDVAALKSIINIPENLETVLFKYSKTQIAELYRSICIIGATGTGKSTTCNTICGSQHFRSSANLESFTFKTDGILTNWFGDPSKEGIFVIDTPGLGDSQGRDTQHIAEMICALQTLEYIHSFIICFNSQQPRVDDYLKAMLKLFMQMFGDQFFSNVIFVLTRWSFESRKEKFRQIGKEKTMNLMIEEFIIVLNQTLGIKVQQEQFIFIDNDYADKTLKESFEQEELNKFQNQLHKLKNITISNRPFYCQDLKAVMRESDALKLAIEHQKKEMTEKQQQFEHNIRKKEKEFQKERSEYQNQLQQSQLAMEQQKQEFEIQKKQQEEKSKNSALKYQQEIESQKEQMIKLDAEKQAEKQEHVKQKELMQRQQEIDKEKNEQIEKEYQNQLKEFQSKQELQQKQYSEEQKSMIKSLKSASKEQQEVINKQLEQKQQSQIENVKKEYEQQHIKSQQKSKIQFSLKEEELKNLNKSYNEKVKELENQIKTRTQIQEKLTESQKKINDLNITCVFCNQVNPTGKCYSRNHSPYNFQPIETRNYWYEYVLAVSFHSTSQYCRDCNDYCYNFKSWDANQYGQYYAQKSYSNILRNWYLTDKGCSHLFL